MPIGEGKEFTRTPKTKPRQARTTKPGGTHTGKGTPAVKRNAYFAALEKGFTKTQARKIAGIGCGTAHALEKSLKEVGALPDLQRMGPSPGSRSRKTAGPGTEDASYSRPDEQEVPYGPRLHDELSPEALKGLEDFAYFRRRYLGRGPSEWQVEAGHRFVELLGTPDREYVVLNLAPGVGKTTFVHDLCAWMICRDRRIRILLGSRTERQAESYVNRLRLTLQRSIIARPRETQLRKGLAVEPEGVLSADYGRFRGLEREVWTRSAFTVAQLPDEVSTEKENTVAAYGQDSGVLGIRPDVAFWDDLVDGSSCRTPYAREVMENWWSNEAETRLERDAGGLLGLIGQRIDRNDLYRYSLDLQTFDDDGTPERKYHHIVYPAHFEDRCRGLHHAEAPSYPEGCLLDSHRLPWRELAGHMANDPDRFRLLYQQEDSDPADAMVQRLWITGGKNPKTGEVHPGCWDYGRSLAEVPAGLTAPVHSYCVADPAPSRYWSVQWWLYEPATQKRHLMDLVRTQMTAPQFLDWNQGENHFVGLMEEWWERALALKVPIKHWIVEHNAAQKFLFQYDHAKRWAHSRGVSIIPHQTQAVNKLDQTIGITSVGPHYRFGRYRLPAGDGVLSPAHVASTKLVNEAVGWPTYATDDCLMAQWFGEVSIPKIFPARLDISPARRPSWLTSGRRSAP